MRDAQAALAHVSRRAVLSRQGTCMGTRIKGRLKTSTKLPEPPPESPPPKPSLSSVKSAADDARAKLEQRAAGRNAPQVVHQRHDRHDSGDDDPADDVLLRSPA